MQDQVFSAIIPRIALQGPSQNAGFSCVSLQCTYKCWNLLGFFSRGRSGDARFLPGVFCKFNPTTFRCLGLFGKDDFAERPMNKITTFQSSSAFLQAWWPPLNWLNATVVSNMQGCFKRGGCPIWTCPSRFVPMFVLFGTSRCFSRLKCQDRNSES